MKGRYSSISVAFLVLLSCTKPFKQEGSVIAEPKIAAAIGDHISKDSLTEPKVIIAGEPEKMPVTKKVVPLVIYNKYKAGTPKIVPVKNPRKITPGQDSFLLPKSVPAISKPFVPGIPTVVKAERAFTKEHNPESFSSFGKLQGLINSAVLSITQDKNGALWLGTGAGVSQYDGKTFTHYSQKAGLCDNWVLFVMKDRKGNLWFCTFGGITKYDGKYFTNYTTKEGLSDNAVNYMTEDKEGNLWFCFEGGSGLNKFDGKVFTHYTTKEGLLSNVVLSAMTARNGDLWFGMDSGACKFDGKSFTHYTAKQGLNVGSGVFSFCEDKNGSIWMGTLGGGAYRFDRPSLSVLQNRAANESEGSFAIYTEKDGLSCNSVYNILEDKKGNLWFSTYENGINKFDGATFTHYTEKEGLSNNNAVCAFEDRSSNLWIGTYGGGLNLYQGSIFTHITEKEGLKNDIIYGITRGKNGELWFSDANRELSSYKDGLFTYLNGIEKYTEMILGGGICDKNGNLWFATSTVGLIKYDGKTLMRYTSQHGLSEGKVLSVKEDRKGNLWIGTLTGGVNKFDGKTFTHYTDKQGLNIGEIRAIEEDEDGNLWFGGFGSSKFNGKNFITFKEKEGFTNNLISRIKKDKKGNLWFGSVEAGLYKLNSSSSDNITFTHYSEQDGLSNNTISSILEDTKGNLWFGTRFGLNKLRPDKETAKHEGLGNAADSGKPTLLFKSYTYSDGFFSTGCYDYALTEHNDGNIWIGTNDGLTVYHPEGDVEDTMPPNVQLMGVDLYYEKIPWNQLLKQDTNLVLKNGVVLKDYKFNDVSKWFGLPENLSLYYNNNYLTFNFIGIALKQPDKVKYQYKLEGLDGNWSTQTNRTDVSYSNLDPGDYTFKIRAVNGDGYWSDDFNYTFTIRPPFWQTWWFRTLMVLLALAIVFGYIRLRTRALRLQERKLARLVEQRTRDLEQSNRDKDRIMQMVVHDLRNPLSGIHRLSSMMLDYKDHVAKHKEMLELINDSSMSLFEMIDDLIEATIKNHKETVKPKETDMQLLVKQSASALEFKANEKKQEIILNATDQLFASVDPQKIQRVLSNLIGNAIKFSPKSSSILVQLVKNNGSVQISIEDHGIGIPEELKDRVFDMFTKAKRHGTAGEEPFGLGLSICKQIVDAHGGKIWFESESGKGTRFYLEFPLLMG